LSEVVFTTKNTKGTKVRNAENGRSKIEDGGVGISILYPRSSTLKLFDFVCFVHFVVNKAK
jgi:hypothetical protein